MRGDHPSRRRTIELLDRAVGSAVETVRRDRGPTVSPLLGSVAAGQPMLAEENVEDYVSPSRRSPAGRQGVPAANPRRLNEGSGAVDVGDFVVVRPQDTARDGDVVVALFGEEATVKRFFASPDHIRLQPENATMEPIRSKEVTVLGRVVGLLRSV